MNKTGAVGVLEGGENLLDDVRGIGGLDRTRRDEVFQQLAVNELHDDERLLDFPAVGLHKSLFAGVENTHDRRVSHLGGILSFTTEARAERGVSGESGPEELDRNAAPEARVDTGVNVGHATGTDEFADLVPAREHTHALGYTFSHEFISQYRRHNSYASVPGGLWVTP